jgi:hypothetical protein
MPKRRTRTAPPFNAIVTELSTVPPIVGSARKRRFLPAKLGITIVRG